MSQKKKKSAADGLIESIMDDLKDVAEPTAIVSPAPVPATADEEKTLAIAPPQAESKMALPPSEPVEPVTTSTKVTFGPPKSVGKAPAQMGTLDAQLQQAENLRMAQQRILELERSCEKLREENDQLSSAGEVARARAEELQQKVHLLEKARSDVREQAAAEIAVFKDNLQSRDVELVRLKTKIQELESRLSSDLKKIRVRERELENRLELSKMEKSALVRSKDETILEHRRKIDQLIVDLESYKEKCVELSMKIDSNQEQFSRTVRALRLALTNLEVHENSTLSAVTPLKKAE